LAGRRAGGSESRGGGPGQSGWRAGTKAASGLLSRPRPADSAAAVAAAEAAARSERNLCVSNLPRSKTPWLGWRCRRRRKCEACSHSWRLLRRLLLRRQRLRQQRARMAAAVMRRPLYLCFLQPQPIIYGLLWPAIVYGLLWSMVCYGLWSMVYFYVYGQLDPASP
jgi:hypothetical protein